MFGKAVASIFLRSVTKERLTDFPKAHTSIMFLPGNQHDQCPTTWSLNAFLRKIKSADVLNAWSSVTLSKLRLEAKKNLYKLCFIYSFQKQWVFFLYIPHIVEDVKKKKILTSSFEDLKLNELLLILYILYIMNIISLYFVIMNIK